MKAAQFEGEGRITVVDTALPVAAAGEVLLKVVACSLCGSDLRPWRNGWPLTPGHEITGVVQQPGHALHGQRCLAYIPVWCGRCPECQAGHNHICRNARQLIGWQRPGGYAEYVAVPDQCLLPVPDDIPDHLAPLLLDTIGTAGHGVRLSRKIVDSGRVLVLGAGPIGLGGLLVLQHFGFEQVDVFDPNPFRRGIAASLGAVPLDSVAADAAYDLVLECSGKDAGRQSALESVRANGAVVQLGEADAWHVQETKAIRRKDFYYIRSFYFPTSEYTENIEILRKGRAQFERLVDAQVPLAGLSDLFAQFAAGDRIKPQLHIHD
ncbi:MAG: alcohol dehydrogenase catalytic domain-containing protein [Rubrivivax sp.]|jgi:threonine dehydrogenase-like Zn-dependent dehydrogenase|nr:alcohol dehydrogenase catalytic domain-containing protein [Rubrivivax sp.]